MVDKLLLYLGQDLQINQDITVHQPSILDIAKFGEYKYFNTVYTICSIPSDFKSELWDLGFNYNKISDFECFILISRNISADDTKLLLGDNISFKDMTPVKNPETNELALIDIENGIVITEEIYNLMIEQIRCMHDIVPKRERAANKETLDLLIREDRVKKSKKNGSNTESILLPLISSMVNSPGFKYDIYTLQNLGVFPFFDSVRRIQAINTANSISQGMYSGMVDISKNPTLKNELNWLRDLSNEKRHVSNVTVTTNK